MNNNPLTNNPAPVEARHREWASRLFYRILDADDLAQDRANFERDVTAQVRAENAKLRAELAVAKQAIERLARINES